MKDDTLIGSNNKCNFYINDWTKGAEQWAKEWGLKNIRCMIAEQKEDKARDYLLVEGNDIIYSTTGYENLAVHIDIIAVGKGLKREDSF
jgi:hypothetical protein